MKIRTFPEDFIVEEYLTVDIKSDAEFGLFTFKKKGWSTFDLISSLSTRLKVPKNEISIAGIKDRHAVTTSYMSIRREFANKMIDVINRNEQIIPNVDFSFIGFIEKQIKSESIDYNKFSIVVRSIDDKQIPLILDRVEIVKNQGVPNYFDDQRFGSARHQQGFVAKSLIKKDFISGVNLLFMTSKYDRKDVKKSKIDALNFILNNDNKIDYQQTIKKLPPELKKFFITIYEEEMKKKSHEIKERDIIFFKAFKSMDRRYLILLFHAYQSYLFNLLLSKILVKLNKGNNFYYLKGEVQQYLFPEFLNDDLFNFISNILLPIPSKNLDTEIYSDSHIFMGENKFEFNKILQDILFEIEKSEKINFKELDARFLGINIKSQKRKAYLIPKDFKIYNFEDDDFFKGKKKVRIEFILNKGSYATMIIKGIFLQGKFGKAEKISF
ncbi:MAG: tRNA pseudouridine(13) synthase TruD [Exilispira sp.]|jgi:tRNA pseudouridine13 synthase|nr:tRNA pseudouridine(13) synthase TruD [Exilispira sp.]